VRHGRVWQGMYFGVIALALTLTPLSAAGAGSPMSSAHHAAPNGRTCHDVENVQPNPTALSKVLAKDLSSGHFEAAKKAMVTSYGTVVNNVNKAESVIKSAPANVRAAFKALRSYEEALENTVSGESSMTGIDNALARASNNTHIASYGGTIQNWIHSVCG
jgi:hypothetical protein